MLLQRSQVFVDQKVDVQWNDRDFYRPTILEVRGSALDPVVRITYDAFTAAVITRSNYRVEGVSTNATPCAIATALRLWGWTTAP